jgi:D-tagatose-1,6-bisphosphate aldolase subunit GatZ/KbaZ
VDATEALRGIVAANLAGRGVGLPSICSAERRVIEAGMVQGLHDGTVVCIESTCNQVNQFGGYTGMEPHGFRALVSTVAGETGFPIGHVLLGGDHLGPWPWRDEPAVSAMAKAADLVRACVGAGYTKIHLDASMRCADDPGEGFLDDETATARTVELCRVAERAHAELPDDAPAPLYVIGTEVPIPGGEQADGVGPAVSRVEDVERLLTLAEDGFRRAGLQAAWERVIAVVTQPGVEFGDDVVFDYDREAARALSAYLEDAAPSIVYEAHSTDYQTAGALDRMVEDHFAILKVGPALTFAMREAIFALEAIERELLTGRDDLVPSRVAEVLERTMVAHPEHWRSHHHGDPEALRLARAFSYSDRARYYWPRAELRDALAALLANLSVRPIPMTLLSQFLPAGYEAVRRGELIARPEDLIRHRVLGVLERYAAACAPG